MVLLAAWLASTPAFAADEGYIPAPAELSGEARTEYDAGVAAAAKGDYQAAVKHFHYALEAVETPATLFNLARAYQDLGDYEAAIRYYRRFKTVAPERAGDIDPIIAVLQARLDLQRSRPGEAKPPPPPKKGDGPLAVPGPPMSEERLAAVRAYRNRRLSVRNVTEFRGGGTSYTPGLGGVYVSTDPIYTVQKWGLFQGNHQIDNPTFYQITGQTDDFEDLTGRIKMNRRASWGLYGIGVAGAFGALVGMIGHNQATTTSEYRTYSGLIVAGLGGMVLGFVGGSFPNAKARKLEDEPSHIMTSDEAQADMDVYNERLRQELGVTLDDALKLELETGK